MAAYSMVPDGAGEFAVEVQYAGGTTELVTGFRTEAEAEVWMAEQQQVHAAENRQNDRDQAGRPALPAAASGIVRNNPD